MWSWGDFLLTTEPEFCFSFFPVLKLKHFSLSGCPVFLSSCPHAWVVNTVDGFINPFNCFIPHHLTLFRTDSCLFILLKKKHAKRWKWWWFSRNKTNFNIKRSTDGSEILHLLIGSYIPWFTGFRGTIQRVVGKPWDFWTAIFQSSSSHHPRHLDLLHSWELLFHFQPWTLGIVTFRWGKKNMFPMEETRNLQAALRSPKMKMWTF